MDLHEYMDAIEPTTPCERCGHPIRRGEYPFCPHGVGATAIQRDEIPGGQVCENGFAVPRRFDSHSAHRAALAAEGCEIRAKWAGPHDKYLINWGARIDPQTMANAAVLVTRGQNDPAPPREWYPITKKFVKTAEG